MRRYVSNKIGGNLFNSPITEENVIYEQDVVSYKEDFNSNDKIISKNRKNNHKNDN